MTKPTGCRLFFPNAFVFSTAISVHDPGAAPQSITVFPGVNRFAFSLISSSLNALRQLKEKE